MEKEIIAAMMASTLDMDNLTSDRIEALTKGHGMLNLAAICSANSILSSFKYFSKLQCIKLGITSVSVAEQNVYPKLVKNDLENECKVMYNK